MRSSRQEAMSWRVFAGGMTFLGGALSIGQFLSAYSNHRTSLALAMAALGAIALLLLPVTQRRPTIAGWVLLAIGLVLALIGLDAGSYGWAGGACVAGGGVCCFIWEREARKIPVDTSDSTEI